MKITLSQVEAFVRKKAKLRLLLSIDMAQWRIVKEADVQSCTYYHLRRFLAKDKRWRIFCEKHSSQTGHFIDLLICEDDLVGKTRGFKPRIAIELKWNLGRISKKDRDSLNRAVRHLRVRKAYFITANHKVVNYQKMRKRKDERFRIHELVVRLPEKLDPQEWQRNRIGIKHLDTLSRRRFGGR
jgi:hypothetical protein